MKNRFINRASEISQALIRFKSTFVTVGVFSAIINLLMLVPSIYMLQVYDRVLASGSEVTLAMLTLMVLGAYLVMGALELIRSFVLVRAGAAFDMELISDGGSARSPNLACAAPSGSRNSSAMYAASCRMCKKKRQPWAVA